MESSGMDKFQKYTERDGKRSWRNEEGLLHSTPLLTSSCPPRPKARQPTNRPRMEHTKKGSSVVAGHQWFATRGIGFRQLVPRSQRERERERERERLPDWVLDRGRDSREWGNGGVRPLPDSESPTIRAPTFAVFQVRLRVQRSFIFYLHSISPLPFWHQSSCVGVRFPP
jgi:hypothetical protein